MRSRNLMRVLRLVHLDGPLARAALTEATGLNRSTIGDLVAELVDRRLVVERAPDLVGRAGRPSPVVAAHPAATAIVVVPEVDAVDIGAVGLDGRVIVRERIDQATVITPEATAALVAARIAHWRGDVLADADLLGVGVAVPGLVRATDGIVRFAPHLGWRDVALAELVAEATGLSCSIGNDASLGARAEHLFGAARGVADVVYLNGGASGIGGGLIVQGTPLVGAGGYAGEFGQNRPGILDDDDRRAPGGVLEDEVKRSFLLEAVGLASASDEKLAAALVTGDVAGEVARQRRILATALANAVNVVNPSTVVLGGFLAMVASYAPSGGDDGLVELADMVRAQSMAANAEDLQDVRVAALGHDRLLVGAAELVFADPLG